MSVCPVFSLITVKQFWHCKMINHYVYPVVSNAHSLSCVLHRTSIKVRYHWLCSQTQILNQVAEYKVIKILELVKVSMQWLKINSKSNVQWIISHPCYIMWLYWSFVLNKQYLTFVLLCCHASSSQPTVMLKALDSDWILLFARKFAAAIETSWINYGKQKLLIFSHLFFY